MLRYLKTAIFTEDIQGALHRHPETWAESRTKGPQWPRHRGLQEGLKQSELLGSSMWASQRTHGESCAPGGGRFRADLKFTEG